MGKEGPSLLSAWRETQRYIATTSRTNPPSPRYPSTLLFVILLSRCIAMYCTKRYKQYRS